MRLSLVSVLVGLTVSACGGGGGGDAPAAGTPVVVAPTSVTLTSSNYILAASEAVSSGFFLLDAPSLAVGVESSDDSAIIQFGRDQVSKLGNRFKDQALATGVVQTTTENCRSGGTLTVTENDADNNSRESAGDSVGLTANNCRPGDGSTINGAFTIDILTLTGNLNSNFYTGSLRLTYKGFSVASSSSNLVANGDMTLTLAANGVNVLNESMSASSFTVNSVIGGTSYSRSLTNFNTSQVKAPNTPTSSYKHTSTVKGTLASSALSNLTLGVETTTPFVTLSTNSNPYVGQLLITGNAGSRTRVTAKSATEVLIELDANGDGTYETSSTQSWASIR
ncbi:MAG: hypothetical protein V4772_01035 [Pseudomonadota bacterium]